MILFVCLVYICDFLQFSPNLLYDIWSIDFFVEFFCYLFLDRCLLCHCIESYFNIFVCIRLRNISKYLISSHFICVSSLLFVCCSCLLKEGRVPCLRFVNVILNISYYLCEVSEEFPCVSTVLTIHATQTVFLYYHFYTCTYEHFLCMYILYHPLLWRSFFFLHKIPYNHSKTYEEA